MRVFVTGIGIVSPLAAGAHATMTRLVSGERAIAPVSLFDVADQRTKLAAEVRGLSVADVAPKGEAAQWSRTDAMAVVAAREALASARLEGRTHPVDLATGGTTGGMFETEELLAAMARDPARREPIDRMLSHPLSATADRMFEAVAPFRRARTLCSACSSGANAIVLAAAWIRTGRSSRVLAGGADGLCRLTYTGFNALAAVDPEPCRPFDRRRAGLTLGEGAAYLLLESEDAARERGATPIAELAGWAVGAEAHHITNPEADGATAARLVRRALASAGVAARDLDYVNAHGTGTPLNDTMESAALAAALGDEVRRVAVSSSKGQLGHTLGAAGAIEAAISALAVARGEIPPTAGLEEPDPRCALAHVPGVGRKADVRAALSSSFGFGGTDTVLAFTRPGAFESPAHAARPRRVVVTAAATVGPLGALGTSASARYAQAGEPPGAGPVAFDSAAHLDVDRARRFDRATRLVTTAMKLALDEADCAGAVARERAGAVAGSAFGSVDACAAFMARVFEKGPRLASPASFPNLVPSSPVGHASIYLGLRGPVLACAELNVTAASATCTAVELLELGEADAMAAAGVEEASHLIEQVLAPLWAGAGGVTGVRSEGASALLLEEEAAAHARGARVVARILCAASGRGALDRAAIGSPAGARSRVVVTEDDGRIAAALRGSAWEQVERVAVAGRVGAQEGASGFALAAAVGLVATEAADEALALAVGPERWTAILLGRP